MPYTFTSIWRLDGYTLIDPASLLQSPGLDDSTISLLLGKANSFTARIGREPSDGYVLVTGSVLNWLLVDALPTNRQLTVGHSESETFVIHNLYIERTIALTPGVIAHTGTDPVTPESLTPETVYLVHLVDSRHFADWTSLDEEKFNWQNADGDVVGSVDTTYEDILTQIWSIGNLTNLLGPLSFIGGAQLLTTQQYRFTGESAWEAFHRVLEDAGCILAPNNTHDAYIVYSASDMIGLTASDQLLYDNARKERLLDTEGVLDGPAIPETLRVHYHLTGAQYYNCTEAETPQDCWLEEPHDIFEFSTYDLLQPLAEDNTGLTLSIIPYTTLSVWSPVIVYENEEGDYVNYPDVTDPNGSVTQTGLESLEQALRDFATEYAYLKWNTGHEQAWIFSGCLNLPLCDKFSEWTVYDYGDGIKTQYKARQSSPLLPQREYPGKPDVHRRNSPHTRIAYGKLYDTQSATPAIDTEVFDEPGRALTGTTAKMVLLYTRLGLWYSTGHSCTIHQFGINPLLVGKFYLGHYNYQAGDYGQWYPFPTGDFIVAGCLNVDHPGRNAAFDMTLGVWNSATNKYDYTGGTVKGIDHRFGVPYPTGHATGLFMARPSDEHGTIYVTLSLDCTSPGSCGS